MANPSSSDIAVILNDLVITDLVRVININETLLGGLSGTLEIEDGRGLLDKGIGEGDNIALSLTYLNKEIVSEFVIDGIRHVDTTTSITRKTYVIDLLPIKTLGNALNKISKVFKGRSSDIIKTMHESVYGTNSLNILTDTVTQGKYVCPNLDPDVAINQILSNSYDIDMNPMFLFQRFAANSKSFLCSLGHIEQQIMMHDIIPRINNNDDPGKPLSKVGVPTKVIVNSSNDNFISRVNNGSMGKTVQSLDISNSKDKSEKYGLLHSTYTEVRPIRLDMFSDEEKPLLNSGDNMDLSFKDSKMINMFKNKLSLFHMQAIPSLGVGHKVNLTLNSNSVMQGGSKFSGAYIVYGINHRWEDGDYTQNIDITRG